MKRVLSVLPGMIALAVMLLMVAGLGAWLFLPSRIAEHRARALVPAMFPGAELVQDLSGSIAGSTNQTQIYLVRDDLVKVQTWFENRMPGFNLCAISIRADCWSNEKCDDSMVGKLVTSMMFLGQQDEVRSCVSIVIEQELPSGGRTVIHVNLGWPSD